MMGVNDFVDFTPPDPEGEPERKRPPEGEPERKRPPEGEPEGEPEEIPPEGVQPPEGFGAEGLEAQRFRGGAEGRLARRLLAMVDAGRIGVDAFRDIVRNLVHTGRMGIGGLRFLERNINVGDFKPSVFVGLTAVLAELIRELGRDTPDKIELTPEERSQIEKEAEDTKVIQDKDSEQRVLQLRPEFISLGTNADTETPSQALKERIQFARFNHVEQKYGTSPIAILHK
jgi:hypothetical protein